MLKFQPRPCNQALKILIEACVLKLSTSELFQLQEKKEMPNCFIISPFQFKEVNSLDNNNLLSKLSLTTWKTLIRDIFNSIPWTYFPS